MEKQLIEFVDGIKSNKQVGAFDEASIKQAIVLRLLFLLGWDIFNIDEVNPNLAGENPHADYALSIKNIRKVFIKVVRPEESLDPFQEKVFDYASKKGVDFAILTNGVGWWFYLSSIKGNAIQNRFAALDFLKQQSDDMAEQLTVFLKKNEISTDAAVKKATDILKKKLQQAARKAIPEAWSQLLSEPNEALVKLIGETAEKICGVPAEKGAIVKFLSERLRPQHADPPTPHPEERTAPRMEKAAIVKFLSERLRPQHADPLISHPEERTAPRTEKAAPMPEKVVRKSYEGQTINSFSLKGKTYKIKSWEELLIKLCQVLQTEHHQDIESLQWHPVGKKYYFNKNQNELRVPAGIAETDIFVETFLNPNEVVKVALSVLTEFGFAESDLTIS